MRRAQPFCVVSIGTQSLNNVTLTDINWDTDVLDTWGMHDPASNPEQIVVPVSGRYEIGAWLLYATAASYTLQIRAEHSTGPTQISRTILLGNVAGLATFFPMSTINQFMEAGTYVKIQGFQASGGALNVTSGRCSVTRVS